MAGVASAHLILFDLMLCCKREAKGLAKNLLFPSCHPRLNQGSSVFVFLFYVAAPSLFGDRDMLSSWRHVG